MIIKPDLLKSGDQTHERNTSEDEGSNKMPLKGSLKLDRKITKFHEKATDKTNQIQLQNPNNGEGG